MRETQGRREMNYREQRKKEWKRKKEKEEERKKGRKESKERKEKKEGKGEEGRPWPSRRSPAAAEGGGRWAAKAQAQAKMVQV